MITGTQLTGQRRAPTYAIPARAGIDPKLATAIGSVSIITLVIIVLSHMSTYSVTLLSSSSQTDVTSPSTTSQTNQNTTQNISERVTRISALDPAQYSNTQEKNTWSPSVCSTVSMTEILNAYWGYNRYRVTDILQQEIAAKAIGASQGLLDNDGIGRTMRRFGFDTTTPSLSLDQLIATANSGTPVIVSFPPATFPGGHLLVVTGGDATTVKLADSSTYNYTSLPRTTFEDLWRGFAAISKPDPYALFGILGPTLKPDFINAVLKTYNSPMQGQGQAIADTLAQYHIDPAIALAFYLHESTMGTRGEATITHAWGNSRCLANYKCVNTQGGDCQPGQSCYAGFDTWIDGLKEWCWQITNSLYAGGGKVLVDDIIPTYAPNADNNDEQGYINALKHAADTWRSGTTTVR